VSQVLPHATQVADRYHLVQNLREHLQRLLDHKRSCLPLVEDTALTHPQKGHPEEADPPSEETPDAVPAPILGTRSAAQHEDRTGTEVDFSGLTYAERQKKISRDKRLARYEEVMALYREGLGQRAMARQLRVSRKTVQRYLSSPGFPERAESVFGRTARKSKLDPHLPYLREQWDTGIHNCSRLFVLVKERGYTGCQSGLRKRLSQWRAELPPQRWRGSPPKPRLFAQRGQRRLSSRSASFLMLVPPEKLTPKQRQQIESMCQASPDLHTVYLLSQEFVTLLKERQAEVLHEWLKRAKASQVAELKSFANGIFRDYAAVYAAFSRSESNGVTEGHVNRLKFLKRQMFGRAHLDLLRVKVLHAV
jgi:transposase